MCAHSTEEPGIIWPWWGKKVLQCSHTTGPPGWPGETWSRKQQCLGSSCGVCLSQKSFSVNKGFCGGLGDLSVAKGLLWSCSDSRAWSLGLVRKLRGGISAASAEMSLWPHLSLVLPLLISKIPHSGAWWPPQHLQPPGKDRVGGQTKLAFSFCHHRRDPKRHIAPITFPQPVSSSQGEHSCFSLQPSEFRSFFSSPPPAKCPVLVSLCTIAPGSPS